MFSLNTILPIKMLFKGLLLGFKDAALVNSDIDNKIHCHWYQNVIFKYNSAN